MTPTGREVRRALLILFIPLLLGTAGIVGAQIFSVGPVSGGGGSATVTNIATAAPITGGTITTSGTIGISDFVASGASHARGTVPDPGASAGTTKFLREDATWATTPGTVAGSDTQVQFNNAGAFGGAAALTWNTATSTLTVGTGAAITTSQPLSLAQTWNAGGVSFAGIDVNITDTASAAGSRLLALRVGGTPVFAVTKTGVVATGVALPPTAFAALGTPADGMLLYCSDCNKATPCTVGGSGAIAKRIAGAWDCD